MSIVDFKKLPGDRLSSTDEHGDHVTIIPAKVKGYWKNRRTIVHIILLIALLALPWIKINGEQSVLLNIPERQFNFFGLLMFAHDGPKIFFLLAFVVLSLALVTALWGRVWCGWACPQTVFIETIFRGLERLIIGNRAEQIKLIQSPMNFKKLRKVGLKWLAFLLFSLILSHTLVSYFVGREQLFYMMSQPPAESWTVFIIMLFITGVVLFDFGWFREQFCIIMCPYGRFQSVLMDRNSKTVTYDHLRGEPRHKGKKKTQDQGDCIDCFKCVSVCPTGIDIRQGQQLECIACTRCIDACDEVMEKVQQPQGLIRYASLNELNHQPQKSLNFRVVSYIFLLVLVSGGLVWSLAQRPDLALNVMRTKKMPFQHLQKGDDSYFLNEFKLHAKNQIRKDLSLFARISPVDQKKAELIFPLQNMKIPGKKQQVAPFFIKFKEPEDTKSRDPIIKIEFVNSQTNKIIKTRELRLVRPHK